MVLASQRRQNLVAVRIAAPESGDLCGREHRSNAVCLARGACVHWAHPHAASFLISKACRLARRDYSWRIFFTYADPSAGDIGTVYQACNWIFLGEGVGRSKGRGRLQFFNRREGRWRSERVLRKRRLKLAELRSHREWIAEWTPDKGRYVWFEGSRREKRELRRALKYEPQPYLKRRRAKPSQPGGRPSERTSLSSSPPCCISSNEVTPSGHAAKLAIEIGRRHLELGERGCGRRILGRPVEARSGQELHPTSMRAAMR